MRHDLTLQTASTVREGVDLPKSILHRNVPLHEPGLDFIPGQLTHCGRSFHYPLSPPQRSIFKLTVSPSLSRAPRLAPSGLYKLDTSDDDK